MKKHNRIADGDSVVESGPTDLLTKYGVGGDSRFIETNAPSTATQQQQQRTSTDAELATDAGGTGMIASIKRYTTKLNVSQCSYFQENVSHGSSIRTRISIIIGRVL